MVKGYFNQTWKTLISSFKDLDARAAVIVLYDLLFYSIVGFSVFLFGRFIQSMSLELSNLQIDKIMELPKAELDHTLAVLQKFLAALLLGFLFIVIIAFIAMCLFKAFIWLTVAKRKIDFKFIKKFALINLVWFIIWIIPLVIIIAIFKKELIAPSLLLLILLMMHFTNILYIKSLECRVFETIKNAFKIGIKKVYLFIMPYAILVILSVIISQFYWLYKFAPENIQMILSLIIVLIFMSWSRIYLYKVVKDIK